MNIHKQEMRPKTFFTSTFLNQSCCKVSVKAAQQTIKNLNIKQYKTKTLKYALTII